MAKGSVNKVIILGHLGQDPEVKYTPNGVSVANISIATNESWKDKNTGELQERTEWHRVVFFGRLAEIVGEYLRKGSQTYVEGRLQTRKWQDKEGRDRYSTEVVANEMQMLGNKAGGSAAHSGQQYPSTNENAGAAQNVGSSPSPSTPPSSTPPSSTPSTSSNAPTYDDFDDDIPF